MTATCHLCGTTFEPHPDSYVEIGYTAMLTKDGEFEDVPSFTADELAIASDYTLGEAGIDREVADELLKVQPGESITTGGAAVCDPCLKQHFGWPQ